MDVSGSSTNGAATEPWSVIKKINFNIAKLWDIFVPKLI